MLGRMTKCIMYLKVAVPSYFGERQPSFIQPTRDVHTLFICRNNNESWVLSCLKLAPKHFILTSVQADSSPTSLHNNSPLPTSGTSPLLQTLSSSGLLCFQVQPSPENLIYFNADK